MGDRGPVRFEKIDKAKGKSLGLIVIKLSDECFDLSNPQWEALVTHNLMKRNRKKGRFLAKRANGFTMKKWAYHPVLYKARIDFYQV